MRYDVFIVQVARVASRIYNSDLNLIEVVSTLSSHDIYEMFQNECRQIAVDAWF